MDGISSITVEKNGDSSISGTAGPNSWTPCGDSVNCSLSSGVSLTDGPSGTRLQSLGAPVRSGDVVGELNQSQ